MSPTIGEALPPLVRSIGRPAMIAYAGATWDWHRLHYDPTYQAERDVPAPVVDGQVFGALLVETMQDALGPSWRMAALDFRLSAPVFAGATVRCTGTITGVSTDRITCRLDVETIDPAASVVAGARAELVRRR